MADIITYTFALDVTYWWVFPVAVLVATIANASGLGGGPFFYPFFLLVMGIDPASVIGTSLLTQAFGMSSGAFAYIQKKLVDYKLALKVGIISVPAAIVGTMFMVELVGVIQIVFAFLLLFIAFKIFTSPEEKDVLRRSGEESAGYSRRNRKLTNSYEFLVKTWEALIVGGVGGLSDGLISTGLGEINSYFFIVRSKVPVKIAVATSCFLIAMGAVAAGVFQFANGNVIVPLATFTIPGVIIGGQLGPRISTRLNPNLLKKIIAFLFVFIALVLFGKALLWG